MSTDDSMRSRVPGSRWKLWLLLDANRWAVAGLLLGAIFAALALFVALDPASLGSAIASSDPVETLFQGLLTAIVTGVTLVVTINQLVLSQELGAVGDQRDRMQGSLEFRDDVAVQLEEPVSPPEPSAFLRSLLEATADRARELRAAVADCPDPEARDEIAHYADELIENAATVGDDLEGSQFGTYDVVQAALGFNYSLKIFEGKRLRALYGGGADDEPMPDDEQLPEEDAQSPEEDAQSPDDAQVSGDAAQAVLDERARAALDDVVTLLEQYGPAREHVKTLYFQWALVDLSRAMLYSAVPALVVTIASILTLDNAGSVGGSLFGVANQSWVVLLAVTVSLAPFALLLSYVLRIATVAKRTLSIGPFVLRDRDGTGDVEQS
ncbi:hypothetical protein L593_08040 [Salinarchaeum sp. Harcht-Bsk1]|uniref:hypothetical protein n=1 Tax=Salinarchaeum sp. Harcht-Bsk1 TaxID=1333523 RepID=UPI0003424752|nr:hypothetical protein [Salinarchaeum sp. Harcht-Bsk1]AGN01553.1 hypothetical protein L593_08040 [Salinarchaeum sp. Harcht-Bsk1]